MLGLLERRALERGDGGLLQPFGQREVGVSERARGVPRHGDDARALARPIARQRHAQEGPRAEPFVLGRIEPGIGRGASRGDHAALVRRQALERRDPAADTMPGDDGQPLAVPDLRTVRLERRGRRARDRLERILDVVGRRELGCHERGDAVEPRLPPAVGEGLGVLERERRQPREGARELDLGEAEGAAVRERRHHERSATAPAPAHRHGQLAPYLPERGVADGIRLAARALHGTKARDRGTGRARARRELLALEVVVEPVRRRDAVLLARRVVDPDRRRVGSEHARSRRRELAEQDIEIELASDRLGGAHERGLREPRLSQRCAHAGEPERGWRVITAEIEQGDLVRPQGPLEPQPQRPEPRVAEHQCTLVERHLDRRTFGSPVLGLVDQAKSDGPQRQALAQLARERVGHIGDIAQREQPSQNLRRRRARRARGVGACPRLDGGEGRTSGGRERLELRDHLLRASGRPRCRERQRRRGKQRHHHRAGHPDADRRERRGHCIPVGRVGLDHGHYLAADGGAHALHQQLEYRLARRRALGDLGQARRRRQRVAATLGEQRGLALAAAAVDELIDIADHGRPERDRGNDRGAGREHVEHGVVLQCDRAGGCGGADAERG